MQGLPMSKETVKSGNAMMINNILQMPVQPYQDGKSVYRMRSFLCLLSRQHVQPYQDGKSVYRVVEVRGRQSGQVRRTPLAVVQYAGKRYLIAPSRGRDWVHNLIASGTCTLLAQNVQEQCHAVLTLDDEAIALVRAYMAQLVDWALQQFPFSANVSDEEMRAKAESFAVFRLSE